MKQLALSVLLVGMILAVGVAFSQNAPIPTLPFSITSTAVALPGGTTFAGVDSGFTVSPNEYVTLADHNLISTDGKLNAFTAGLDYHFPSFSLAVNNKTPTMSGFRLLLSIGASFGESRVNLPLKTQVHFANEFHGELDYSLTGDGMFQLGVRAGAGRFPYYTAKGYIPMISFGPSLHF